MDTSLLIGKVLSGDTPPQRDAIHIAVIPVVSRHTLEPGEPVDKDSTPGYVIPHSVVTRARIVGVVDPFLRRPVKPGERFWLFLTPGTITSLKHEWTHPDFPDTRTSTLKDLSRKHALDLLELAVSGYAISGEDLLSLMTEYDNKGALFNDTPLMPEITLEMWQAWENITGLRATHPDSYFSCAC